MRAAIVLVVVLASCSRGREAAREPSSIRWHEPVELARGGGTRGEWRQNQSDYDHVDDATVVLAADGSAVVAWVDHRRKEIFVQRRSQDGAARGAAVAVSRTPGVFSWLPRLAVSGDDVYVLWQEIVFSGGSHGGEVFFARSRDRGATFEPPQNLSRSQSGDGKGRISRDVWHNGSLDLALAPDGTLYAVWTEYDGPLWLARSTDRGGTFSQPTQLTGGSLPARAPALAASGDRVYLAWSVGEDPGADIRIAVSRDRGQTFAPRVILQETPGYSDAPKLAVDDHGTLHVAWSESRGGPFDRTTIRYTQSRDGGATFAPPQALSAASMRAAAFPMLAVDGDTVLVSWELVADEHQRSRGLGLAYSRDRGATFSAPEVVAHSFDPDGGFNGSHQGRLMEKVALRDNTIVIANSALARGRGSRVWLVRGELPTSSSTLRASASSRPGDR